MISPLWRFHTRFGLSNINFNYKFLSSRNSILWRTFSKWTVAFSFKSIIVHGRFDVELLTYTKLMLEIGVHHLSINWKLVIFFLKMLLKSILKNFPKSQNKSSVYFLLSRRRLPSRKYNTLYTYVHLHLYALLKYVGASKSQTIFKRKRIPLK